MKNLPRPRNGGKLLWYPRRMAPGNLTCFRCFLVFLVVKVLYRRRRRGSVSGRTNFRMVSPRPRRPSQSKGGRQIKTYSLAHTKNAPPASGPMSIQEPSVPLLENGSSLTVCPWSSTVDVWNGAHNAKLPKVGTKFASRPGSDRLMCVVVD
jgi:hypothetical protein